MWHRITKMTGPTLEIYSDGAKLESVSSYY